MIACNERAVFATEEDWGLVQNSFELSGIYYEKPARGWAAEFVVNEKTYSGRGWYAPDTISFVKQHRNASRVTSFTRLSSYE